MKFKWYDIFWILPLVVFLSVLERIDKWNKKRKQSANETAETKRMKRLAGIK